MLYGDLWGDGPVVHGAFGWIVTESPCNNDGFLAFREPTLLASKPACCLRGTSRHQEESRYAEHASEDSFNKKQPSPARVS